MMRHYSLLEIISIIVMGMAVTVAGVVMLAVLPVVVVAEWWRLR